MTLNLAKRPFVDTRPVNALTAVLLVAVVVLSVVSFRTFRGYLEGSRGTQAAITELRKEIARYEDSRRSGEAALARYDVEELAYSTEDANEIARRRSFSWTRFLTRLEVALPHDVRVTTIALSREEGMKGPGMPVDLTLVSRDPLGLPKTIRAFYASAYFDGPEPVKDENPERGIPEGRRILLRVRYLDAGRPGAAVAPAAPEKPAAASKKPARARKGAAR